MGCKAKVSVVIAVYGVEKYIEQCVRTLFGQTLKEIEYIFVDDCSPDRSVEIMQQVLEEFPERKGWVKLIRHETNQGVGAARNHGVAACTGEYVIHCDPDDWVELDMYETMYNRAKETDADMVYCDWIQEKFNKSIRQSSVTCCCPTDMLNKMFLGRVQGFLWNKLYRSKIALHETVICSDKIIMCEDLLRNTLMLPLCKKISSINNFFYHYRFVETSASHSKVESRINSFNNISNIVENMGSVNENVMFIWKSWVLRFALRSGCGSEQYQNLFPEFQKNLKKIKLRFDKKIVLVIAKHNMVIARWLDIVLVMLKGAVLSTIYNLRVI